MNKIIQGSCHAKKTKFNQDTALFQILKTYVVRIFHFNCNAHSTLNARHLLLDVVSCLVLGFCAAI